MLKIFTSHPIIPVFINNSIDVNSNGSRKASLFFGGQYTLLGLHKLKSIGITAIVDMRSQETDMTRVKKNFNYFHLPTPEHQSPSLNEIERCAAFIENEIKEGGKVYINCLKGHGRGPTMVMAYLIRTGKSFEEAHKLISDLKKDIKLNVMQYIRLQEYESYCKEFVLENELFEQNK